MTHNITINGKPCKIDYSEFLTLEDCQLARETGNGMPNSGKVTITESENFYKVFEFCFSSSDVMNADLRILYKRYNVLPDGTIKDLGSKEIGVSAEYFCAFMNNTFPQSNSLLIIATAINRILTAEYGADKYECRVFKQSDLTPMQPLLFDLVVNNKDIEVNVTDSESICKFSLDKINWQDENIFTSLNDGIYTVFVKDNLEYVNQKNITISTL